MSKNVNSDGSENKSKREKSSEESGKLLHIVTYRTSDAKVSLVGFLLQQYLLIGAERVEKIRVVLDHEDSALRALGTIDGTKQSVILELNGDCFGAIFENKQRLKNFLQLTEGFCVVLHLVFPDSEKSAVLESFSGALVNIFGKSHRYFGWYGNNVNVDNARTNLLTAIVKLPEVGNGFTSAMLECESDDLAIDDVFSFTSSELKRLEIHSVLNHVVRELDTALQRKTRTALFPFLSGKLNLESRNEALVESSSFPKRVAEEVAQALKQWGVEEGRGVAEGKHEPLPNKARMGRRQRFTEALAFINQAIESATAQLEQHVETNTEGLEQRINHAIRLIYAAMSATMVTLVVIVGVLLST